MQIVKTILLVIGITILFFSVVSSSKAASTELLSAPWHFDKYWGNQDKYQALPPTVLNGMTHSKIVLDLHGICLNTTSGLADATFDQPAGAQKKVSMFPYLQNCLNGPQTLTIPLSSYVNPNGPLNPAVNVGQFHIRFYYEGQMNFDVSSVTVTDLANPTNTPTVTPTRTPTPVPSTPTRTPTPIPTNTPTPIPPTATPTPSSAPTPTPYWSIRSVDAMKVTKDVMCAPKTQAYIDQWTQKAFELGSTHVAISQSYDGPACSGQPSAVTQAMMWVNSIRSQGMKVWHRHMPQVWEGMNGLPKSNANDDYFEMISAYIKNNPTMFQTGDIFTPIPEPQQGGISGTTGCAGGICQFSSKADWNQWLRNAILVSNLSFETIGLGGQIKVGYYGFDGYLVWCDNNSGCTGTSKLEQATVAAMGNVITIDHYPQNGATMAQDLAEYRALFPTTDLWIGEWGNIEATGNNQTIIDTFTAFQQSWIKATNYWHMGPGGNEALINSDFTERPYYGFVQDFYKP